MAAEPPKFGIFEKINKKSKGTLHGDHSTQKTRLYTLSKKFPMGGQAHNNNFQNAQKCGPRGYDPPLSTPIDQKWSNSIEMTIL